ncbi:hypothetical protein [Streptomyces sp. LN590]|uniref:hypothetical protein n=1 Tax=unclassified Streptomyces TaxID=2593676 RepID=UPI0037243F0B
MRRSRSDEASAEQITAVRTARAARTRRLRKDLAAAQHQRYAAVTRAEQPKRPGSVTEVEAGLELAAGDRADLAELALPDLIPPAAPPSHWHTPPPLAARTRPLPPPTPDDEPADEPETGVLTGEGDRTPGGGVR